MAASLSGPSNRFPSALNRRPVTPPAAYCVPGSVHNRKLIPSAHRVLLANQGKAVSMEVSRRKIGVPKRKGEDARERIEERNRKIASQKAVSIILRREAMKAVIEKKKKGNPKKLLPKDVLEALHERVTALRWESALTIFELLREQLWYKPNAGVYIKLIVMLGKCKQPEKAQSLFQMMVDEGCDVNQEAYTALLSAYSRSGLFGDAFSLLEQMKSTPNCQPDVFTYTALIKSCLEVNDFGKVRDLLSEMECEGIKPNTATYNTLMESYGKAKRFAEMESVLVEMLRRRECSPDLWTMNSALRAYGGSGQIEMMEKCYEKFQSSGIDPTIKTFNILLDSYGKTGNYEKMSAVMEYMHKYHFSWTLVTYNIVLDAYGRAGDLNQMEHLFRLMQSERIKPDRVTLCSLVRAYGQSGKAERVKRVLRFAENSDIALDNVFFNCLVGAYGMMGCIAEMKEVVEFMGRRGFKPDKVTYRIMIKACASCGMSGDVKELKNQLASLEGSQGGRKMIKG
ncbi:hypothetical protein DM860_015721 [Cuscuta australis]|uniref:Pentacotripeptide-repeat region of PRORP domain-containing protein n=1 Tax=Cuscuta australis TaxID=267555 RepID=A0A328DQR1_9ASTE|nr:hypothetical protein DM860_015721 [Cuscuta australis]